MAEYSRQDLEYAAQFREEIHREALAIVRKTRPNVTEVLDRHPVEDYFQEHWDYPGKWYTIVSVPSGCGGRKALIDAIVRDTLTGQDPEPEQSYSQGLRDMARTEPGRKKLTKQLDAKPEEDPFYRLLAGYPDLVVDYCIAPGDLAGYQGYPSHRRALAAACKRLFAPDADGDGWNYDLSKAAGKRIETEALFTSRYPETGVNYRKAFLYPPHENGYTGEDFARVNAALFPQGTEELEAYEWNTDWSDYFDEGREWWGTLCLSVFDKRMDRFAVILASATD